jgi:hypothetical protein
MPQQQSYGKDCSYQPLDLERENEMLGPSDDGRGARSMSAWELEEL